MRMLAQKMAGKSLTAIARAEHLSRGWVRHELDSDDCRQVILRAVNRDRAQVVVVYVQTVQSIEEAFQAQSIVQYQGKPVVLGPDHYARLAAAKRFIDLVTAGRPVAKAPDDSEKSKQVTLKELEVMLAGRRARQVAEAAGGPPARVAAAFGTVECGPRRYGSAL
jgi:hypothetical protein